MFGLSVPGNAMNTGVSSLIIPWVSWTGFSGKHPVIHTHVNNPAARTDRPALITMGNASVRIDGMMFDQMFELTFLPEGQSLEMETQSSDLIFWKHGLTNVCIRCHLEPYGLNHGAFSHLEF
jgi:hypothetical protein